MHKEMLIAKNEVEEKVFLDIEIDPSLDVFGDIEKLKKKKMWTDKNSGLINWSVFLKAQRFMKS